MCPLGYAFVMNDSKTDVAVKLALKTKNMINDVDVLLDQMLPLNMTYSVIVMWNSYEILSNMKHDELSAYTHKSLREDVFTF